MSIVSEARHALEYIRRRRHAYCLTFNGSAADIVLADLAHFCRANESCFDADPRLHAVAEGRREVWLRIQQHLRLPPEKLFEVYTGHALTRDQLTGTNDAS